MLSLLALRTLALQARAAGEHGRAAEAWRATLRRQPHDWTLALELKRDLKATLQYPDADPQFRQAARHLPDAEWLAHYTALFAYHMDDLDALHQRATDMLQRFPDHAALLALRGDVSRQRRDWPRAAEDFAAAERLDPGNAEHAAKRRAVLMHQRVSAWLQRQPPQGDAYGIAVVNLDRNTERYAWTERLFGRGPVPLHRVPAIEGSRLPTPAVHRLLGDAAMRGTLGCFLSHAAAWESLAMRGLRHLLVIEDDVIPLADLPAQLGPLGLPPGYDICFVNDRLEPRLEPDTAMQPSLHRLADALRGFPPEDNAPGGDGYLLSAQGAAKLLHWVAQDGFAGDLDWRLLAYGVDPASIAALPRHAFSWQMLDRLCHEIPRADRLDAYVLHPALIRTVGISSDREDENRECPA
jgi:GR25 family glycosyltransferase involved in LPS biosynthesis